MSATLRVLAENGTTLLGVLPEFQKFTVQEEFNGLGSISVDYPENGKDAALLSLDTAILVPVVDGVAQNDWYLLEDDGEDPAASPKAGRIISASGRGVLGFLEEAEVYPWDWSPGQSLLNKALFHAFANASPGTIMRTLIQRAQTRGALLNVTYDFTDAADSNGVPWPTGYTRSYDIGTDYTKVLEGFRDDGWADFRMRGLTLQMYVPNTIMGVNRPETILHVSREVTSGPRQRTRRTVRNALLVVGDEGAIVEANATGLPPGTRRREGYDGRGGVTDVGALTAVGQREVNLLMHPAEGYTLSYAAEAENAPQPFVDYGLGDFIRYDQVRNADDTAYLPMRVRSVARDFTPSGQSNVSVELNDLIVEIEILLARKIDAILNGSTSNNRAPTPPAPEFDKTVPKAPASVSVDSATYVLREGLTRVTATITWAPVTQNTDDSNFTDFGRYEVQFRLDAETHWRAIQAVGDGTTLIVSNLRPGGLMDVRVRAVDFTGKPSDWTELDDEQLATDIDPPAVPTAPQGTPYLGTVRLTWDGRGSNGEYVAPGIRDAGGVLQPQDEDDFEHTNVWMSQAQNFALGDPGVTKVGEIRGVLDALVVTDLALGQPYYFAQTTVDRFGNESARSAITAGVTPEYVVAPDIADAAITTAKVALAAIATGNLADGAVTSAKIMDAAILSAKIGDAAIVTAKIADAAISTAKIADLAVQNAKIADLSVGKLLAGRFAATFMELGGLLTTAAQPVPTPANPNPTPVRSGARVELDATGLRAYNATSTSSTTGKTVDIKNDGSASFTGTITGSTITGGSVTGATVQTAASGPRIVLSPVAVENSVNGQQVIDVGIIVVGRQGQSVPLRITNYEYVTQGSADNNSAMRISGGVANTGSYNSFPDYYAENSIIIYPRDATDEGHEDAWNSPYGSGGGMSSDSGQGITFVVCQRSTYDNHDTHFITLKGHAAGPYPVMTNYFGDIGIGWSVGEMKVVNYLSNSYRALHASNLAVPSEGRLKRAFADVDHRAIVRDAPARRFRYRAGIGHPTDQDRHGPVAEDLPPEVLITTSDIDGNVVQGVDLITQVGVLWGSEQQSIVAHDDLNGRHDGLAAKVDGLAARIEELAAAMTRPQ